MRGKPRVLIVGAAGQVGTELRRSFADFGDLIAVDRESVDLAVPAQVRDLVRRAQPDVILNAAAYTAVDRAETDAEAARAINADAPRVLAEEASQRGALLVHYSTDYVFDGTKREPWTEADMPNALNVYGATKLAGEQTIQQVGGRFLIFRTSWVYGPHGANFLLTMLRLGRERDRLAIVNDQHGAPTTSIALADATYAVVQGVLAGRFGAPDAWAGLYHMTCSGSMTWYGFAQAIFSHAGTLLDGRQPELKPIPSSEYPTPARRPANSVLSNARLKERFAIQLPPWEEALSAVMVRLESSRGSGAESKP